MSENIETQSYENLGSKKTLLDYCREYRNNLKEWFNELLSSKQQTSEDLNSLKDNVETITSTTESNETMSKDFRDMAVKIVSRSRKYDDVNKNDVGSVSFGRLQWHVDSAVDLLKELKNTNPNTFNKTMTDPLFKNLDKAGMAIWNDTQAKQFKQLMQGTEFQQCMDNFAYKTVDHYIERIHSRGITDPRATLAWVRIHNSGSIKAIKDSMVKNGKDINDYKQVILAYENTSFGKRHPKFKKPYSCFGGKNLTEVIGEYTA